MSNSDPKISNLKPFVAGRSGNPGGKPVGSRNKLQGDFMRELADDFSANGRAAIIECRTDKPETYLKIVALLMPKDFAVSRPFEGLSDEELKGAIAALRSHLASTLSH